MNRYDICIFDLDGTLIDSLEDLADSCNEALKMNGMPVHDTGKYRMFVGSGIKNLIKRSLLDNAEDEILVQRVYDSFNLIYQKNCLNKTKPYSGVTEMLSRLKCNEVKLCILSNKADDFSRMIVGSLFDCDMFDLIWGKKPEYPIKPDPSALLAILAKFSIKLDRCLYIGDSDVDCITAKNAGVNFLGVEWGFRGRDELETTGARNIARCPKDIIKAVCINE